MVKQQTVDKQANLQATPDLTPDQEALQALWEEHIPDFSQSLKKQGSKTAKMYIVQQLQQFEV